MRKLSLALRNIGRNPRRSAVTISAVAISCGGLAIFGGYVAWTFRAVEEQTVGYYGHVQIYKKGYYERGTGNPTAYAIEDYEKVKQMVKTDPVIAPLLDTVTGQLQFNGMATSVRTQASSTFTAIGVFPSEDERLLDWDAYGITRARTLKENKKFFDGPAELADDDIAGCSVGLGLADILQLRTKPLPDGKSDDVSPADAAANKPAPDAPAAGKEDGDVDLGFLTGQAGPKEKDSADNKMTLDLFVSPPAGGMPNATTVNVRKIVPRASKELEDTLIKMHIKQASALLFPEQPIHVTTVVLLLKQTKDTDTVLNRLQFLIDNRKLDLEFKRWEDIRPFFLRMKRMIGLIFDFVFVLMIIMVAFLIYNTQAAGIIERLGEIGTVRAMGVRRLTLWQMLVAEGLVLGLIGGTIGVLLAILGEWLVGLANIVYIPPTVSFYAKLETLVLRNPIVLVEAFVGSVLCAIISSALPARKAARMPIVEALRHS